MSARRRTKKVKEAWPWAVEIRLSKDGLDRLNRVAAFYNKSSAQILIDLFEREDAYGQSSAARRRG